MPNIDTLLDDIRAVLTDNGTHLLNADNFTKFALNMGKIAASQLAYPAYVRSTNTVRASELGTKCGRQFHYKVNHPSKALPLDASTKFKFMYGNLIEEMVLLLAREAGHEVTFEQHVVDHLTPENNAVIGHIDAMIDGVVVDVKSTSTYGFDKMVDKDDWEDSFGYKPQLSFYSNHIRVSQNDDPRFLLVDKTNGRMGFSYVDMDYYDAAYLDDVADALVQAGNEPVDTLGRQPTKAHARGQVLDTVCSYCAFKKICWKDAANNGLGLRGFAYSEGPKFFTTIKKGSESDPEFLKREFQV